MTCCARWIRMRWSSRRRSPPCRVGSRSSAMTKRSRRHFFLPDAFRSRNNFRLFFICRACPNSREGITLPPWRLFAGSLRSSPTPTRPRVLFLCRDSPSFWPSATMKLPNCSDSFPRNTRITNSASRPLIGTGRLWPSRKSSPRHARFWPPFPANTPKACSTAPPPSVTLTARNRCATTKQPKRNSRPT